MPSTVLTIGTFDTPHAGHAALFRQARMLGDRLVVGVNSDLFVERYKGEACVFNDRERRDLVMAMGYDVALNDGPGADLIREIGPDILAVGSDWATRDYYEQIGMSADDLFGRGTILAFIPRTPGISTSMIRFRLKAGQ